MVAPLLLATPSFAQMPFSDDFNRADSPTVGNGWVETEGGSAAARIGGNRLVFDMVNDVNLPRVVHTFTQQTAGVLRWRYAFNWDRTGSEGTYELWMQLGENAAMVDPATSNNTGVAVNLKWGGPNNGFTSHEGFGYVQGAVTTEVAVVSGGPGNDHTIEVFANLTTNTFDLIIDGVTQASGVAFDNNVPIDAIRIYADGVNQANFATREFDDVLVEMPETILLVVPNAASLGAQDAAKKALIESWGYAVFVISANDTQANFDAAVAVSDAAYVSEEVLSSDVGTKLRDATIGVLLEENALTDEMGISSTSTNYSSNAIDIVDNTHYITSPFSIGSLTITSSAQPFAYVSGTLSPDLQVLAEEAVSTAGTLVVLDTGDTLWDSGTAAACRVQLPWGGSAWDINSLNANGLLLMRRSIEWAIVCTPAAAGGTISGRVFEDADFAGTASDWDGGVGDLALPSVDVELYDNTDTLVTSTTTDASGNYSFGGVADGTYKVRARSATIGDSNTPPMGGFNGACAITDPVSGLPCVLAEQTWGNAAALYGGQSATVDDTATNNDAGPGDTYVTVNVSGGGAVTNVNFGFAYNLIVNVEDGGQGSLRQFIENANAIGAAGGTTANSSQFRMQVPANAGGGTWWQLSPGTPLPAFTDASTTLDGTTQTTNGGDTNLGLLGVGGTVGVDALPLPQVAAPEIEITDGAAITIGLHIQANSITIRGLAAYGFGAAGGEGAIVVENNFTGALIEDNVLGSSAGAFTDPGAGSRNAHGVFSTGGDNGTVRDNLLGFNSLRGIQLNNGSTGWTVTGNEFRDNAETTDSDGLAVRDSPTNTFTGNLFTGSASQGIVITNSADNVFTNNTVTGNGVGTTTAVAQSAGITMRSGTTGTVFDRNVVQANYGAGIQVNDGATTTRLTQNSFADNGTIVARDGSPATGQIGIDLNAPGDDSNFGTPPYVTINDSGDADTGGNDLFNFPILETASVAGGNLTLTGWARPNSVIELFIADSDPSNFGEGETYLVTLTEGSGADTDPTVNSTYGPGPINGLSQGTDTTNRYAFTIPTPPGVSGGTRLTATATLADSTSEFSGVVAVTAVGISGRVFEDADFAGTASDWDGGAGDLALPNVDVELYDNTDTFIASTTTDASGNYSFSGVADGTYKVRARSATIGDSNTPPRGGFNGACGVTDPASGPPCVLAEQTWGNGAALYGGQSATVDDTATNDDAGPGDTYVTVVVSGGSVSNVNLGFAYNLIVNADDSGQGSLRQFIENANAIGAAGGTTANTSQFRMQVPANEGTWWRIVSASSALPAFTDAGTVLDGSTQTTNGGDTNPGEFVHPVFGLNKDVGTGPDGVEGTGDEPQLPSYFRPEIEIDGNDQGPILEIAASNTTVRRIALFNNVPDPAIEVSAGSGSLVTDNFIGVRADGTDPGAGFEIDNGVEAVAAVDVTNNVVGYNEDQPIDVANATLISGNDIFANRSVNPVDDSITVEGSTGQPITIRRNRAHAPNAYGIETWQTPGPFTIEDNTVVDGGQGGGVENGGIRIFGSGSTIRHNVVRNSVGAGITVVQTAGTTDQNRISENAIYSNGSVSVDIDVTNLAGNPNGDGVTPNNGVINASLPNDEMDYPVFTVATLTGSNLHVEGYVGISTQRIAGTHTVEVFKADDDGNNNGEIEAGDGQNIPHGEGRWFIDSCATAADGTFSCDLTVPPMVALADGEPITATATDASNNTSEFTASTAVSGQGTIQGHVFEDVDGDGTQDAGEPDLVGVDVTLTPSSGPPITVTTDANGNYSTTVPAGDVDADVTDPANSTLTTGNDPQTVTVPVGGTGTASDVGFQFQGTIQGHVFEDVDGDGTQDAGEPDLAGVDVTLTPAGGGSPITVTTDANGDYSSSVPSGDVDADVTDPANSMLTTGNDPQTVTVPTGGTGTAGEVGFQFQGTIQGHVFEDVDGDGVQGAGEPDLAGVDVVLTPAGGGAPVTVTTDANGDYSSSVPAGDVDADVTDPAGAVLTTGNDPQTVTVPTGGTGTAGDVGFQFQGTIQGHVFEDVDGDGAQGAGEPDLAGVDVTLTPAGGGAPITVTTDANGDYSSTVPAGDVDADVTDPAGAVLTTGNDPQTVTVPIGGTGTASDVGFQFQGTIQGHVFEDVDGDGVQGAGEPDLAGVDVTLTPAGGGSPITVTTDASGDYSSTVPSGDVDADVTDPAGSVLTTGNDPQTVTVPTGGTGTAGDVGFQFQGTITGHVFEDVDGDGAQGAGEPDLAGVDVTLTPAGGGSPITVTTDANGDYSSTVPSGDVDADVTDPAGSVLTTGNDPQTVTVPTGGTGTAGDVGFQFQGTIQGHVFEDVDGDGVQGAGEPDLAGVDVTLTPAAGGAPITVTTDGSGNYSSGVPSGDVDADVTDPASSILTTGNDPQTVTVPTGGTGTAGDVGFQFQGTIDGHVFEDVDGDGVQGAGEPDLAGVDVTLTPAGGGAPITVTTDANGDYSSSVPTGDVDADVTDPAGAVLTTGNDPQTVTVPTGGTGMAGDVGFQFQGTITGHVFNDVDGDGTQGAGEPDLVGVDVTLTPAGGGSPITVTTDANGDYSSTAPSGDVDADVTDPASSTLTTGNDPQTVTVPTGGTGTAGDVGFQFQGTIQGHVFEDVDGDGTQGAGEPDLAGVDVTLTPAGGGASITVTTDASGNYSSGVPSGDVDADVTDPASSVLTTGNDPQTVTVPVGGTGTATDVGFQFQGTIQGHVFEDVDGDGTQGAGESDLAGVDVTLTPAGGGAPITVTTDANGDYSSSVPAGDVDADVTDPAGSVLTTGNDPQTVTVPTGGTGTAGDVGFQFQGTIQGHVFEDVDGDGVQGAGEPDLAGVDVTLTPAGGGSPITVTTDGSGNYSSGVPSGDVDADVTDPASSILTTGNDPQTVTVPTGGTGTAGDVGFQFQGTITGHVFEDVDGDGVQDPGEPDLAGVDVTLTPAGGGIPITVTTDANGDYSTTVPSGDVDADVIDPASSTLTTGNDPQTVAVPTGGTGAATDVGFQFSGMIDGHVFDDTNGDGVQDPGEPDLAGVDVVLNPVNGSPFTVTTDANGDYSAGVPAGDVNANVTNPPGSTLTTGNDPQTVTVPVGGTGTATDVGFQFSGTITGHVFEDVDGDGIQDPGEPDLAGVDVDLTPLNGSPLTVTTDASGNYTASVPAGDVDADVVDPASSTLTTGNDPQTVTVPAVGTGMAADVGFQFQGTITGHVFNDTDGDGVQDPGEADLAGVDVDLTPINGSPLTVTTDANGDYSASVPAGDVDADVVDPASSSLTTGNDPQTVTVPAGGTGTATDVGFQFAGTITGHVFEDVDGDGIQGVGEPDLAGVDVTLTPAGGGGPITATTDANGDYSASVPAGDIDADVVDPASSTLTTGNDPQTVTVPVGGTGTATDVGFQLNGTVTGHVFNDTDGDGLQDPGEPDLAGVDVDLTPINGGPLTVTTDANGDYSATVPSGDVDADVVDPASSTLTTANDPQTITVPPNGTGTATDVGFQFSGTITGHVFDDVDGNGVQDVGEPDLAGIDVDLTPLNGSPLTVTTDVNGDYSASVPAGDVDADVVDPASSTLTTANDPQTVTVPAGGTGTATDVGFQLSGTVTGHLFEDVDGDGIQDPGEPGLAGVEVVLNPTNGSPLTVTTNASGNYSAGVPAGDVTANVTNPASSTLTTANDPQTVTVPAGGSVATTAVGFQFQGTIDGHVFDDVDGDGAQGAGEPDLAGVDVTLTPAGGGAPITVTTDANGDYSSTIPAGDVDADVTDPAGGVLTTANDPQTVTVPVGGTGTATDVGFQFQGTITGHVFDDVDGDGAQGAGEPDLAGVDVTLTPAGGGAPITVTTDGSGNYSSTVPAGDVDADVTDPAGGVLTTANDPQTVTVPVGGTGTATDVGFQFQGTVDGHVFDDVDGDGAQGAGEPDLAGVDVTLTPAGGGAPITVTTDVNGDYTSTVPAGDVDADVTDPANSTLTTGNDPQTVTVPVGGTGTATDVGFQFQGTITGHVFDDVDGDGAQGAGEADLAGVDVTLTPAGGGAPVTVTTDASGNYSSTVPAGDVDADVTDPAGGVLTTANDPQTVTVPVGGTGTAGDVGFQFQGTITGHVFDDVDGDGAQGAGEPDLAGVDVTLTPAGGGAPVTVTTDANGNYSSTIPAGDVDVDVTDPAGGVLTTANDPQTVTVPVGGTGTATDVGFQFQGTITGHVFDDVDGDGAQGAGEPDLAGVDVTLTPAGGGAPITVTTDASGNYSSPIPAGDVDVDVTDPAGGVLTTANDPQTVTVPVGGTGTATDVGFQFQGTITGHVFDDVDGDGAQGAGEPDLAGVDVVLTPAGGGAPITVTTDANGDYSTTIPAGDVDVDVTDPAGGTLTTANDPQTVTVPVGGTGTATDVGFQFQGTITGHVFDDIDGDGAQGAGEPDLAGVDVVLTPAGGGAPITVTTDANGDYSTTIPAGDVDVDVTDPAGGLLTTANDPQTVVVPVGGTGTATDVGFQFQGTITGHLFDDVDGDGAQGAGEPDLAGVDVVLTPAGGGAPITVTTDANGDYSTGIPAGDVDVDVTDPAGGTLTTANDPQTVVVPVVGTGTATDVGFQFQGTIDGHVFDDVDGDGAQGAGEPDLAGVDVVLTPAGGGAPITVTTDANGDYSSTIPAGDVDVDVTDPAGGTLTTANDPQTVTIPVGGTGTATDVGFQFQGTITGHVFDDVDGDGVQGAGEPDLAAVDVVLTPAGGGAPITVTTDANGDYSTGIPAGDVDVDVTDPAGGTLTTANDPQTVTVPVGGTGTATDVGFQFQGTITGHVFDDVDGDGVQGAGEPDLAGVDVVLTPAGGGAPVTVTTDATGNYSSGIPAGDVDVDVTDPAGGTLTTANDPQTVTVPVGGTGTATDVGFQFSGTITGHVFEDIDGDGFQGAGEPDLAGVDVVLTPAGGGAPITVTTDVNGNYSSGIPAGDVDADVVDPVGSILTTANDPQTVIVPVGGTGTATDVGYQFPPTTGTIDGHVFGDTDGDGIQDPGEPDLSGIDVVLTPSSGPPITVTTDANGDYSSIVPAGDVDVDVTNPAGGTLTTGNDPQTVSVPAGGTNTATPVGFQFAPSTGTINGHVFGDTDGNGVQDPGEPDLAGVDVVLTPSIGLPITVTTDVNGDYSSSVPAGDVDVDVTDPAGSTLTTGNDPQTVSVPAGGTATATDVGFQFPPGAGTIIGHVFRDVDADGVQDPGEPNIAGVTVVLTPSSGPPITVTTNINGDYSASVPAGDVTADVTDPAGSTLTTGNDPQTVTVPSGGTGAATDVGFLLAVSPPPPPPPVQPPNLVIVKTGPAMAAVGDTITYTITVTNSGGGTAHNVTVTDELPAGAVFVDAGKGTLSGGTVQWPAIDMLAPGSAAVVYFVRVVLPAPGTYENVAVASWTSDDSNPRVSDIVITEVGLEADVVVTKSGPRTADVGDTITYVITTTNVGPGDARDVLVTDNLPAGIEFVSASRGGTHANGVITWPAIPVLTAGESVADTVRALVTTKGEFENVAAALSPTPDPDPTNNDGSDPDSRVITKVPAIDLAIEKSADEQFQIGVEGTFTITITNVGADPTTSPITVTDTLPAGVTVLTIEGEGFAPTPGALCSVDNQVLTCENPGEIEPGETATLIMTVMIDENAGEFVTNKASVSNNDDVNPENDTDVSGPTPVVPDQTPSGEVLRVDKQVSRAEAALGDFVEYTITVSNPTDTPIENVVALDVLPTGLVYLEGSTRVDGTTADDPTIDGTGSLAFQVGRIRENAVASVKYRVQIGAGTPFGEAVNIARAVSVLTGVTSNIATATLRVTAGLFNDEGIVTGKVFLRCDDCGSDDPVLANDGLGVPGIRIWMEDGTSAVTDNEGNFTFVGVSPRLHVIKIDPTTLPVGGELMFLDNRQRGDLTTRFVDIKKGELFRADFGVGVRHPDVIAAVYARRKASDPNNTGGDPAQQFEGLPTHSSIPHIRDRQPVEQPPLTSAEIRRDFAALPWDVVAPQYTPRVPVTIMATETHLVAHDLDASQPGIQLAVLDSEAELELIAPVAMAKRPALRFAASQTALAEELPPIVPPMPFIIAGVLEGRIDFRSNRGVLADDRFEDQLSDFAFGDPDDAWQGGARGAVFMKGELGNDILLTLRYDSERDARTRLFRDIRPDELYPVYGDASIKRFDAQSNSRFYARLERGPSYVQFGDITTPAATDVRTLGAYYRSLNGIQNHFEWDTGAFDAFVSRGSSGLIVDEFPGQGISGPYSLTRPEGLINSERVEIVTRDRNHPDVILKIEPMTRFVDYSVEPLTGRLIFRRPISSVDRDLNPITIRVSYEVEQGGDNFWTVGSAVTVRPFDRVELGGSITRDENPFGELDLWSVNAALDVTDNTRVILEYAASDSSDQLAGDAQRIEVQHRTPRLDINAFAARTDVEFFNRTAGFGAGRNEIGIRGRAALGDRTTLVGEVLATEDRRTGGDRRGAQLTLQQAINRNFDLELGYLYARESTIPASPLSTGGTPNETNSVNARLRARVAEPLSVFGELNQDLDRIDQWQAIVGGDYRISEKTELYARHEFISSFAGPYALNQGQRQNQTLFGLRSDLFKTADLFAEYRAADAFDGREAYAAIGVANRWTIGDGLRLDLSFERLNPIEGENPNEATAVATALEYTRSPSMKATGRIEYRLGRLQDQMFFTGGLARKLDNDWTFLGQTSWSTFFDQSLYERTRLGLAWRQTQGNRWNALARYEHKYERDNGVGPTRLAARSTAHILSTHASYKPADRWTLNSRLATKFSTDRLDGIDTDTDATLLSIRSTVDLTNRLDLGVMGRSLFTSGIGQAQWGLGLEAGFILANNLRLATGYNLFGFSEDDLADTIATDHGFYFHIGLKFDERLFGIGEDRESD